MQKRGTSLPPPILPGDILFFTYHLNRLVISAILIKISCCHCVLSIQIYIKFCIKIIFIYEIQMEIGIFFKQILTNIANDH